MAKEVKIIKDETELLHLAVEMAEKGIKPVGFDVKTIEYPVSITIEEETFFVTPPVVEEPKVEAAPSTPKKKKNTKKILAITLGSIAGVAVIVGIVCAIVFA